MMKAMPRPRRTTSYLFMLLNTVVWGASLILVKPAFDVTTPFRFLLYRYIIAGSISLPFFIRYLTQIKNLKQILTKIVLIEILGSSIALSLLYTGLNMTSAIQASLISTTTPIFISVLAVLMLKEKEESHELMGLIITFLGTLLLTVYPLLNGHAQIGGVSIKGNLLIMGQNIATAFYFVFTKKYYQKIPKMFVAMTSFYVSLFTFAPLALLEAGGVSQLMSQIQIDIQYPSVWIAGVFMGIFGSIIGYTAYLKGQEGIEASEATLFSYLQPLIYIPMGIWLLHESVSSLQIISLLIILVGVVIAEKRWPKR